METLNPDELASINLVLGNLTRAAAELRKRGEYGLLSAVFGGAACLEDLARRYALPPPAEPTP